MKGIYSLIMRRMRLPLILVIVVYAVSVLGFTLIPGQDADGNPWRMGFFHAFYFVSFMATTIGFGEVPYSFTEAQRLWATFSIYLTVTTWFYALGALIALLRDPVFGRALGHSRFRRAVERIREPFYLICGAGDTGMALIQELTQRGHAVVAIEINPDRVDQLKIADLRLFVPALVGDANLTDNLLAAGLKHTFCAAVIAVTNSDHTNLQIAITAKLLNPKLKVIARAEQRETVANMKSFGTDFVINPFEAFAANVATAMRSADALLLEDWLTTLPGKPLSEPLQPPRGRWVICAYGRAGQALQRQLNFHGVPATIIDPSPLPEIEGATSVRGKGTEMVTLREARVQEASAIFAATHNDADNLSILMTAREINPDLFLVGRQNNRWADAVFEAAGLHMVMTPSRIMATEILAVLAAPLLADFLRYARHQKPEWATGFVEQLRTLSGSRIPDVWTIRLDSREAPAVVDEILYGRTVTAGMLELNPRDRDEALPCMSLMLQRGDELIPLPPPDKPLVIGDHILMCGREGARQTLNWTLRNHNALRYIATGEKRPDGWLWRKLHRVQEKRG